MGRDGARPSSRNFERFDVLFDFVNKVCGCGAVYDPVIECERKGDDFRRFILLSVRNQLAVSTADKERAD